MYPLSAVCTVHWQDIERTLKSILPQNHSGQIVIQKTSKKISKVFCNLVNPPTGDSFVFHPWKHTLHKSREECPFSPPPLVRTTGRRQLWVPLQPVFLTLEEEGRRSASSLSSEKWEKGNGWNVLNLDVFSPLAETKTHMFQRKLMRLDLPGI